jgi:hypothetical protein
MGWDSKPSYPPGATQTVTVKATPEQKSTWEVTGRNHGLSAGGFLAFAADLYLAMYRAYLEANDTHYDALHPTGLEGQRKREEERAKRREEGDR